MVVRVGLEVRPADSNDQRQVASLIHFESYVHRHLDWRTPLDWLGSYPFYVAVQDGRLVAALACPPDPPQVAWIRLFACDSWAHLQDTWLSLWEAAKGELIQQGEFIVAGISLQAWYSDLLQSSDFHSRQEIVMLEWTSETWQPPVAVPEILVRAMSPADLGTVARVDAAAFPALWQNSLPALQQAYAQSAIAMVAEMDGGIIGYQISTQNPAGYHLARLAVRPEVQGRGVGVALLSDLGARVNRRGGTRITVNTQSDNFISMRLYRKMGFRQTGEHYPVYTYHVK